MTNTTNILTSVEQNTEYQRVGIEIYDNRLFNAIATDRGTLEFYESTEDYNGLVLHCPLPSNSKFVKLNVGDQYRTLNTDSFLDDQYYIHQPNALSPSNSYFAICRHTISQSQESDLERIVTKNATSSFYDSKDLMGLFGRITTTINNNTLVNTHYTVPENCCPTCPVGYCFGPFEETPTFTTSEETSVTSTKSECRRVVAVYLRSADQGISNGAVLTDDEIRSIEDPCGTTAVCYARSIGDYPSKLKVKLSSSSIVGEPVNSIVNVIIGASNHIPCNISESGDSLITERVVYADGECSDFEDNTCLHENNLEELGDFIFSGTKTINHETIVDNYIVQECAEPACGSEYCLTNTKKSADDALNQEDATQNNNIIIIGSAAGGAALLLLTASIIIASIVAIFRFKKVGCLFARKENNEVQTSDFELKQRKDADGHIA